MTILVTGATDGLGLALARHYAARGRELVLVGRRAWRDTPLITEFDPRQYCRLDLSQPDGGPYLAGWLRDHEINSLEILIHNAGVGYVGSTASQPWPNIETLMQVNLWAPIALTQALLPWLRLGRGKVVFISSVVSALPCPNYAVYGASKAALEGFARNLRAELRDEVAVQVIRPGATRTGMHAKSGLDKEQMDWTQFPPAGEIAALIARDIERGPGWSTVGPTNRLLRWAGRYLGGVVDAGVEGR